ncbi:MAG: MerR family transcriptional regulator [Christensenellales bacterium]
MLKIGEFSVLAKTTVKTLRFYEKEGLLRPCYVDTDTGYRYYETSQLTELSAIIALRQTGFSIKEIREYSNGNLNEFLTSKRAELKKVVDDANDKLRRIEYLLKEKSMKREVITKELPGYTVYYKEGTLKNYSDATQFILSSAEECLATNPDIKCIQPDYCFMSYLDGEYKEKNIRVRYCQAVEKAGVENETIKFTVLQPLTAACIYHKGSYDKLGESYGFIMKWIDDNGYVIVAPIRERYIDGMWNKDDPDEWLTEIQVPVKRKD